METITPSGGVLRLDKPETFSNVLIRGAVYITSSAGGTVLEPSVKIEIPAGFKAQAGAVQCCASDCRIGCEIDIGGNAMQGVQTIEWDGPVPENTDISNLYAYNNSQQSDDPDKHHGIYVQDSIGLTGSNIRFRDIKGGWGIHFYCDQTVLVCRGARLSQITCEDNLGDVIFWGPGVEDNRVEKLLSLNPGKWGALHQNTSGANGGNTLDFVSVETAGYGYQGNGGGTDPAPVDDPWPAWYATAPRGSLEAANQAWVDWFNSAPV